ncbi:hypothetical protein Droror1_Dr00024129 [Drosera rotundifolia]
MDTKAITPKLLFSFFCLNYRENDWYHLASRSGMVAPEELLLRRRNVRLSANSDPVLSSKSTRVVNFAPSLTQERRKRIEKASNTSRKGEMRGADLEPLDSRPPKSLHTNNTRPPRSVGSETGLLKLDAQSNDLLGGVILPTDLTREEAYVPTWRIHPESST